MTLIGAVRSPRVFSLAELRELPQQTQRLTLVCAANALIAKNWETREWTGVPFAALAEAAGSLPDARSVGIAGYDGVVRRFSLDDLGDALLAFEADGHEMSAAQGYPARLLIPGRCACEMPRFIHRLSFHAEAAPVFDAPQPFVTIEWARTVPGGVRLEGQAFATDSVVVRLDDGPPVVAAVVRQAHGLAGHWVLEWPGADAARTRFSAEAWPLESPMETQPLARRWKAKRASWTFARNREP